MICVKSATIGCILFSIFCPFFVHPHALPAPKVRRIQTLLRMEPAEVVAFPGDDVTFRCIHPSNVTFQWEFNSEVRVYKVEAGRTLDIAENIVFYSRIVLQSVSRRMSGEIVCSAAEDGSKANGFLLVNGVLNGLHCRKSGDCGTDRAICQDGVCECPRNFARLRIKERDFDVCREMIYSLYDPCEYDEQCAHLVDPKSVCRDVCVCGPTSRDKRGKCVSLSDISYSRSQEMYRVGLIAVTCIIILIVSVSHNELLLQA